MAIARNPEVEMSVSSAFRYAGITFVGSLTIGGGAGRGEGAGAGGEFGASK